MICKKKNLIWIISTHNSNEFIQKKTKKKITQTNTYAMHKIYVCTLTHCTQNKIKWIKWQHSFGFLFCCFRLNKHNSHNSDKSKLIKQKQQKINWICMSLTLRAHHFNYYGLKDFISINHVVVYFLRSLFVVVVVVRCRRLWFLVGVSAYIVFFFFFFLFHNSNWTNR